MAVSGADAGARLGGMGWGGVCKSKSAKLQKTADLVGCSGVVVRPSCERSGPGRRVCHDFEDVLMSDDWICVGID